MRRYGFAALCALAALCLAATGEEARPWVDSYAAVLEDFVRNGMLPDGNRAEFSGNPEEETFAVVDVTGDDVPELILRHIAASMAGQVEWVLTYDPEGDAAVTIFQGFPAVTYYVGGLLRADTSHNQGLAGDGGFWPHTLHRYSPRTKRYEECGFVDAWSKSDFPANPYEGDKPFPDAIDEDGDGMIYSVTLGDERLVDPNAEYVDGPAYRAWEAGLLRDAGAIAIPWVAADVKGLEKLRQGK